jgi:phosphoribosylaminoimidazole-succinocarboxamide synthase
MRSNYRLEFPLAKNEILVSGRTKKLLALEENFNVLEFGDSIVLPDGKVRSAFEGKGAICAQFSEAVFHYLDSYNIASHFVEMIDSKRMKVRKLEMLPIYVLVRNFATADLVQRFQVEEGRRLEYPIVEHYTKGAEFENNLVNDSHCLAFDLVGIDELRAISRLASKINAILRSFFERRGLVLADFRLEFGKTAKNLLIADEFSPDSCRLWDLKTRKKFGSSSLKSGVAGAKESYEDVLSRVIS